MDNIREKINVRQRRSSLLKRRLKYTRVFEHELNGHKAVVDRDNHTYKYEIKVFSGGINRNLKIRTYDDRDLAIQIAEQHLIKLVRGEIS